MPSWNKIKAEYIREGTSYRKLAAKYSVSPSTLYRHMRKEKWADLRKQSLDAVNAEIVESVAKREAQREDRIQTAADILTKQIEKEIKAGRYRTADQIKKITSALRDLREITGKHDDQDNELHVVIDRPEFCV